MKKLKFLLSSLVVFGALSGLVGCGNKKIDYVSQCHLDASISYQNKNFLDNGIGLVTVKKYVDGDTTHFIQVGGDQQRTVKVRYLGVDTPESTGQIQKWGKQASNFTRSKLENAKTILLTTDIPNIGQKAQLDSTGSRYTGFVWYSEKANCPINELKLLNLFIVQEGFSQGKSLKGSPLTHFFTDADLQAQNLKLHVYSNDKDPLYDENAPAVETTLQELAETFEEDGSETAWNGAKVKFRGIVYKLSGDFDCYLYSEVDGKKYGIYVFAMYTTYTPLRTLGNEVEIIGNYTLFYGNPQLVSVSYSPIYPDPKKDMKIISTGNPYSIDEVQVSEITNRSSVNMVYKISNLLCYNGKDEIDSTTLKPSGALTLRTRDEHDNEISIRVPEDVWVMNNDGSGRVTTWTEFKDKKITIIGAINFYAPDESDPEKGYFQIRLCVKDDFTYFEVN